MGCLSPKLNSESGQLNICTNYSIENDLMSKEILNLIKIISTPSYRSAKRGEAKYAF